MGNAQLQVHPARSLPASSLGLAVNPASCAWLLGLLETLWEKLCLGLCVLGCPQGRRSEASTIPLPFVDLIHHMTSPHQHERPLLLFPTTTQPPPPCFQDPAKKSDNKAIGTWGGAGGVPDTPGFLSLGIPWPYLCVPSAFKLCVAEGVKITNGPRPRFESQI